MNIATLCIVTRHSSSHCVVFSLLVMNVALTYQRKKASDSGEDSWTGASKVRVIFASPWPQAAAPGPSWTCKVAGGGGGGATDGFYYFHIPTDEVKSILLNGTVFVWYWKYWNRCAEFWTCQSFHVLANSKTKWEMCSGSEHSRCYQINSFRFAFLVLVVIL